MSIRRFLCLAALIALTAQPALAQQTGGPVPEVPEALEGLVERGAQIRYLGKEHGLDGWIAIYQGQEQYYYVTNDGKAFVTGLMFGADGRPITIEQVQQLQAQGGDVLDLLAETPPSATPATGPQSVSEVAKIDSPAERMYREIESSNWIRLGSADAPFIYSFIDPQCPHCHEFLKDIRKTYIDSGKLQVRLVPVGFIDGSLAQASFLLASPDAEERFYRHLDGEADALPAKSDISTQAIQKNMALMQAWKFNVTPLSVYRSGGGEVKIVRGRAKDAAAMVADLQRGATPATRTPAR